MARIITIETSGGSASAALSVDGRCVALEQAQGKEQTHRLTLMIEQLLKDQALTLEQIDAVAVSQGPGSYTGLRIGVSVAKGLCFGANKPLIAVGTLDALCAGALSQHSPTPKSHLVAMIDARRMEIYTATYTPNGERVSQVEALVVDQDSFAQIRGEEIFAFGSGAAKCAEIIGAQIWEVDLSAKWLCELAEKQYNEQKFEDVAYFEPQYIKEFVALSSQKKLF